jgi:hypothetical protein
LMNPKLNKYLILLTIVIIETLAGQSLIYSCPAFLSFRHILH